ncbi:hypothetical protein ES703_58041 [subsurface metagenome]
MATTIDRRFLSFGVMGTTGDLTGIDPLFINETGDLAGDFHLQSSSPANGCQEQERRNECGTHQ